MNKPNMEPAGINDDPMAAERELRLAELTRQALDEGYQAVEAALGPDGVRALVEERNTAQARVKELEGQLAEVKNSACLNCDRSLPPDGDCYGCAADKAWAENASLKAELAEANARAEIWEQNYATSNPSLYAVIRRAHDLVQAEKQRAETAEAQLAEADARLATLRQVVNRIAAQVGHPPIAQGEIGIESVAEAVARRLEYAREREETKEALGYADAALPPKVNGEGVKE
jgi:DNA repair exonuclease SbcCD ATPase subunit